MPMDRGTDFDQGYDVLPNVKPRPVIHRTKSDAEDADPAAESLYLPLVAGHLVGKYNKHSPKKDVDVSANEPVTLRAEPKSVPKTRSCMDELIDIMDEYKAGRIDDRQVEIFFDQWKSRKDVIEDGSTKKVNHRTRGNTLQTSGWTKFYFFWFFLNRKFWIT